MRTTSSTRKRVAALGTASVLTAGLTLAAAAPAFAAPVVPAPDSYSTDAGVALVVAAGSGLLANDIDPDAGSLGVSGYTNPSHGSLTLDQNSGAFSYMPAAGFTGSDTFDYYVTDYADGVTLGPVPVTITVVGLAPVTQPPVAVNDSYPVPSGTSIAIPAPAFLVNDTDPDSSFAIANTTAPVHGQVNFDASGGVSYTPDAGFVGPDTMTYRLSDPNGNLSNWATVTFDVQPPAPVNTPPVAQPDAFSTLEGTHVELTASVILANDADADGDVLTLGDIIEPVGGWLPGESLLHVPGGEEVYFPPTGYTGTRVLRYQAFDGVALSTPYTDIVITIDPIAQVNHTPVAAADAFSTPFGSPLTVPAPGILADDTDADGDQLTVAWHSTPSSGTLVVNDDGSLTFTPEPGFSGAVPFNYTVTDGTAESGPAEVVITVEAPVGNQAPVAVNDEYVVTTGGSLDIPAPAMLGNDIDLDGDPLSFVSFSPQPAWLAGESFTQNPDGSFGYVPPTGFVGTRSIGYTISDGQLTSEQGVITIQVKPSASFADAPVAVGDAYLVVPGETLTVSAAQGVLANDSDQDGDPITVATYGSPASGTFTGQPDGSFTFAPAAGFTGTVTLPYTATDGTYSSAPALITITVEAPRDEEPGDGGDPGDGGMPEFPPAKPELPTQPEPSDDDDDDDTESSALASTGADSGLALGAFAAILLALGAAAKRLSRRAS